MTTAEDADEGWACPRCEFRTAGMTLADRDAYEAHLAEHRDVRSVVQSVARR